MSKKKKIIISIALMLILGLTGSITYLNQYYLPKVIKEKIITGLSSLTFGEVKLEKIHFNLLRGVVIYGLTLYDKDNPQQELCSIKEASATILILPSFKAKKIIIPSVTVKTASIHLVRRKDNSLNISYLFKKTGAENKTDKNSVFIKNIDVMDSSVFFTDNSFGAPIAINMENININARVSLTKAEIKTSLEISKDAKKSTVEITGAYGFFSKNLTSSFLLNTVDVTTYQPYLGNLPITITSALLTELKGNCLIHDKDIQVQSQLSFDNLSLQKDGLSLQKARLDITTAVNTKKDNLKNISYQGEAALLKGSFSIDQTIHANADIDSVKTSFSGDDQVVKLTADIEAKNIKAKKDDTAVSNGSASIQANATVPLSPEGNQTLSYQGEAVLSNSSFSMNEPLLMNADIDSVKTSFSGDNQAVKLAADIKAKNIKANINDIIVSKSDASIQANITIPFTQEKNQTPSYQGKAVINAQQISGIPKIQTATAVTTKFSFAGNNVVIENITAQILNTYVQASGALKDNVLSIDANGNFQLNQLALFLPKHISLEGCAISGASSTSIHFVRDLNTGQNSALSGKAVLNNIKIACAKKNMAVSAPHGDIEFDIPAEQITCRFDRTDYLDKSYSFNGGIKGFSSMSINAAINDETTSVKMQAVKDGDIITLSSLQGKFIDSDINLKGTINLKNNMSLLGNIVLDLKDLKYILPEQDILEKIDPKGKLLVIAQVSGPIKNWRLWNINTQAKCKTLTIYGLNINDLDAQYTQIEKEGFLNSLTFNAYDGTALLQGRFNFTDKAPVYNVRGKIENIDINLLKSDTLWKDKVFYGAFSSLFSINGDGFDPKNITGEGNVSIEDGNIWEFNPLKGMGNFLFSPGFTKIAFTHAHGDFSILNGYVLTNNLELLGSELGLLIEGKISFKGDLDFLVNTQIVASGPLLKSTGIKKIEGVVNAVGGMTTLKIGGTVEKPTYKLQSIEKNIVKSVGSLISNIFQ